MQKDKLESAPAMLVKRYLTSGIFFSFRAQYYASVATYCKFTVGPYFDLVAQNEQV
jgi:hypothetical protein